MSELLPASLDKRTIREIKDWLLECVHSPKLSTPLAFLNKAYEAQNGRAVRADFKYTLTTLCPGITVVQKGNQLVVLGIAPRWTRGALLRAIRSTEE